MTMPTQTNVAKLYVAFFGRAPDTVGLDYWVNKSGLDLEGITKSFFEQKETIDKYGNLDSSAFITEIYKNVLNREPDAGGLAYWVGELGNGNVSKDQMILAIINGAQNDDVKLLEHKADVGIYFAAHNQDDAPDAFQVIKNTDTTTESVTAVKQWIDGEIPDTVPDPRNYFPLNDAKADYKIVGTAKDDVFMVQRFHTASISGGEGSDTLDFTKYPTAGVSVNLSTGVGPNNLKFSWIENVRGTDGADNLVGNSDANILVAAGGSGDRIDAQVGNDLIIFKTADDVSKAVEVNGGQNDDTLLISNNTEMTITDTTFSAVSDVETLYVGFKKEGAAANATLTLTDSSGDGTAAGLAFFKEIKGTESYDKKQQLINDVIRVLDDAKADNNTSILGNQGIVLDVSNLKLTSIETVSNADENGTIRVGPNTLTSVKEVIGDATDGDNDSLGTTLLLNAKAGDVFDMTKPNFTNIDRVNQNLTNGLGVASTLVINQTLVNSLAATAGTDGFRDYTINPTNYVLNATTNLSGLGSFSEATLKVDGIGLDLGVLRDGDTNFKSIQFNTAKEITIGNVNDADGINGAVDLTSLRTIVGSENDSDLLRIKPDYVHAQNLADVVGGNGTTQDVVSITKVERLDFEETSTVALDNANLTDVKQISGDNDQNANRFANVLAAIANAASDGAITAAEQTTLNTAYQAVGATKVNAGNLNMGTALGGGKYTAGSLLDVVSASGDLTTLYALENILGPNLTDGAITAADKVQALTIAENAVAKTIIDAGFETDVGGLDLKGIKLQSIFGLGNNVSGRNGTVTIDDATSLGNTFKSLDLDSVQTINLSGGAYDFSTITEANAGRVLVSNLSITNDVLGDSRHDADLADFDKLGGVAITGDRIIGSAQSDTILGAATGLSYVLNAGDDVFVGSNTANEIVFGGAGNDEINLGNNSQNAVTINYADLFGGPNPAGGAGANLLNTLYAANTEGAKYDLSKVNPTYILNNNLAYVAATATAAGSFDGIGAFADGGDGDDHISSDVGNDVLFGGAGHDTLSGGAGTDVLAGGEGDDILSGGSGNDVLIGGDGNDVIQGDAGIDEIYAGKGVDSLRGGTLRADGTRDYGNQDHFHFNGGDSGVTASTVDSITDFLSFARASTTDINQDGAINATDAQQADVIYLDWYLDNGAAEITGKKALDLTVGAAAGAVASASGLSYDTLFENVDDFFASDANLLTAAEHALDRVYTDRGVAALLNGAGANYTSVAAQFEYGGKEYLAINAYVDNTGINTNNFNAQNDLLIELSATTENWALSADASGDAMEIVVTRWDTAAA